MTDSHPSVAYFDSTGKEVPRPNVIRAGTAAAIFNERREVLLEKRSDNGFWGLPGGAVDIGESVAKAVVREVSEETGLLVRIKRLVGLYSDPSSYTIASYPDGNVVHYVVACFECERLSGELQMSEESTDMRYFPTGALPENTLLSMRIRIQDAVTNRVEPYIR